eukprot:Hpha_TRINITY_DN35158_c0_g1::TRINITY_DN35158_c0_g1_i1::g.168381::m.168381
MPGLFRYVLLAVLPNALATAPPIASPVRLCCTGQTLRLGVPRLNWAPVVMANVTSNNVTEFRGFFAEVWDWVTREMGVNYTLPPFDYLRPQDMVAALEQGKVDAIVYPSSFEIYEWKSGAPRFHYSIPVIDSYAQIYVYKSKVNIGLFRFLEPFRDGLWLAVLLCTVFLTVCLVVLRLLLTAATASNATGGESTAEAEGEDDEGDTHETWGTRLSHAFYRSWAAILGGDSYDWRAKLGAPGRLLQVGVLLFVLILVSTYTANLAAFFTRPSIEMHGPKSASELREHVVCTAGLREMGFNSYLVGRVAGMTELPFGHDPRDTGRVERLSENLAQLTQRCLDHLKSGKATAWVDAPEFMNRFYLQNCNDMYALPNSDVMPFGMIFVFHGSKGALTGKFNVALEWLRYSEEWILMRDRHFGFSKPCPMMPEQTGTEQISFVA